MPSLQPEAGESLGMALRKGAIRELPNLFRYSAEMTLYSRILLSLCLGLILPSCTSTETTDGSAQGFAGTWVFRLGERPFIVMTLKRNGERFEGTMSRPEKFETPNGVRFSNLSAEVSSETIVDSQQLGDSLHVTAENSRDATDRNEYELTLMGEDTLYLQLVQMPIEPLKFVRVQGEPPAVATDWESGRSYSVDDNIPSNAEIAKIFEEDQAVRQNFTEFSRNAEEIDRGDKERREQVRQLLAEDQLHTAEDFRLAASIFQHGNTPEDYLLAHTFAMIAAAKGDEGALWIGSATLDRYLQTIGQPQIFGTQFKQTPEHTATLEPYDRNLVDDALRRQLGVPVIALQEQQLEQWTEQFQAAAEQQAP